MSVTNRGKGKGMLLGILAGISVFSTLGFIVFFRASLTFQRRVHQLQKELEHANDKAGEFFERLAKARGEANQLRDKVNARGSELLEEKAASIRTGKKIDRLEEKVAAYKKFFDEVCGSCIKLDNDILEASHAPQEETPH